MDQQNNQKIDSSPAAVAKFFDRKIDKIYPSPDLFRKELLSGRKMRFYMGADTTAPRMHIGHLIPFLKMAQLQKMGHEIIFLMGDFTGKIGDPTDKSAARTKLTDEEVKKNSAAFLDQIKMIFNFDDPVNPPKVLYNSEWNSKLTFGGLIELASNFTVQQMLERDMFQKRLKENKPIYLHEFLYPLMQGNDSVMMKVDGEFGGTDQTFNMLAGRMLEKVILNKEKFVLTMKLLLSADGVNKMSKSIGNCIFITDSPEEKYGKIMAIPDSLLVHYYELLTDLTDSEIQEIADSVAKNDNPMQIKKRLAALVVKLLDGEEQAQKAGAAFEKTVQNKEMPDQVPDFKRADLENLQDEQGQVFLKEILTATALTKSNGEAKRMIQEGGVEVDGQKITDPNLKFRLNDIKILRAGKRNWCRLVGENINS
jgi:tyrosyl-tRNA synthetase